jgi:tyrosyl-tRNA synthetase
VWLNEDMLPSYDFWQYWRNTDDRDVGKFLRLFTDLPLDEIARLESLQGAEINQAKVVLASEVTKLVRGDDAARTAEATASSTFEGEGVGEGLPTIRTSEPISIVDALDRFEFCASRGEARRLIRQGGARLNGEVVTSDILLTSSAKVSAGRKRHGLVILED